LWDVKDADQAVPIPSRRHGEGPSTEANVFAHCTFGSASATMPPDGRLRLVLDAADAQPSPRMKFAGCRKA